MNHYLHYTRSLISEEKKKAQYWKDNFIQQYLKNSRWQALQANIGEYNTNT